MHITPPRDVASTKLYMCKMEGAVNVYPELFASASDQTPMREDKCLSFGSGPGSHPLKPLALVMRCFDTTVAAPREYLIIRSRYTAHSDLSGNKQCRFHIIL